MEKFRVSKKFGGQAGGDWKMKGDWMVDFFGKGSEPRVGRAGEFLKDDAGIAVGVGLDRIALDFDFDRTVFPVHVEHGAPGFAGGIDADLPRGPDPVEVVVDGRFEDGRNHRVLAEREFAEDAFKHGWERVSRTPQPARSRNASHGESGQAWRARGG